MKAWRRLAGPTNSTAAKESAPNSLRALYGTDGTKNAVHGSDSLASAFLEINFCFSSERSPAQGVHGQQEERGVAGPAVRSDFVPEEKMFALLQPGTSELHKGSEIHRGTSAFMECVCVCAWC